MFFLFLKKKKKKIQPKNSFSYFSTETYVVGAKKTRLIEMVLWAHKTYIMYILMGNKIITNFMINS